MGKPLDRKSGATRFYARRVGDWQDEELHDELVPTVDSLALNPPRAGGFQCQQLAGGVGNHVVALLRVPPGSILNNLRLYPQEVGATIGFIAYGYRRNGQAMGLLEANLDAVTALDGQGAVDGSRITPGWDSSLLRSVTHCVNNVNSAALPLAAPATVSRPPHFIATSTQQWAVRLPDLNTQLGADLIFYADTANVPATFSVTFQELTEPGAKGQAAPTL